MFERLWERGRRQAERRAQEEAVRLAERMRAELPGGIRVEAVAEGGALSGRGLARRFAIDPALRWLTARLR